MMRNHLCWIPGAVRQVINPYADDISDSLFRAIHSDWDLKVSPKVGTSYQDIRDVSYADISPKDFLEDFLRPDRPHALAAILGESGSGKSHLVHWMQLNIKPTQERVVLTVKKSGTSLRNIVKMIIEELPEDQQASFFETLQSAGDGNQSRDNQKQQLLNDIAQVIREEVLPVGAEEIEVDLVNFLPDLFQDPHMRKAHFLGDNTVISEIVDHIFSTSNSKNRPEQRRVFVGDDLPLGGLDFAKASELAKAVIEAIDLNPTINLPLAIKIINRNLDLAVARTLSFSGNRVEDLMVRLRTYLKSQGKELILLIEEFARLQGIDRALLQAITSQGEKGDDGQCKMRTAIAVTTGFFKSVEETAYARTTHIVDMDRSAGRSAGREVTKESLSKFTARYLNAVRLGPDEIENWNQSAQPGESPPSRCNTCEKQVECHAVFGEVDGYGLYPFTTQSLWNAASRADSSMPTRINPRVLQNDLLVEVMDNFAPDIETGRFPPFKLLEKLGGITSMSVVNRTELSSRSPQNYQRFAAFLELYDGTGKISNLDPRLRGAFDVPEIPGVADKGPGPDPIDPIDPIERVEEFSQLSKDDILIEQWASGKGLDQALANRLKLLVFSAVSNFIDWDLLGLSKTSFVGNQGKAFQTASISFDRQTTQVRNDLLVKLVIPGDLVPSEKAAAALQGVVRASKNQYSWDFQNGDKMLCAFLDCVEIWGKNVERQLLQICQPSSQWSQAAAAIELLCMGAAIGGRIKPGATVADMTDAAFSANWPEDCASTAPEMTLLYRKLTNAREKLAVIARSQISSLKGGQHGAMLHPGRVVAPIRAFRQSKWQLRLLPPENDMQEPAKTYREVLSIVTPAVSAELARRKSWLSAMENAFGVDLARGKIVETIDAARETVATAGIGTNNTNPSLRDAVDRFRAVHFDDTVAAARAIPNDTGGASLLPYFGRGRRAAVEAGMTLVECTEAFLKAVDQNIDLTTQSADIQNSAVAASLEKIEKSLTSIEVDLIGLSSGKGDDSNVA